MRGKSSISIVVIVAVLIFYGGREYIYYREAMKLAKQANAVQSEVTSFLSNELDEALYSRYNDKLVPGTSIKTASDSFLKSDFQIEVKTLGSSEYVIYTADNTYSPNSINDKAYFKATLIKDNGKVTGIRFDQTQ